MTDLARSRDGLDFALVHVDSPSARPNVRVQLAAKRVFDVVLAVLALVVVAPILLLLAVAIRTGSPGGAFFRQTRVGRNGRRFRIFKFRTMVQDAESILDRNPELRARYEENNFKLTVDEDPRLTPIGKVLRRTSLDELPQLWNVLRGDMSLVGARPVPECHFEALGPAQWSYTQMRPGITGIWQVNGRNLTSMSECNAEYVGRWSLTLDALIMCKTVPAVLRRHGAF